MKVTIDARYQDGRGTAEAESAMESDMVKLCTEFGVLIDGVSSLEDEPGTVDVLFDLTVPDSVGVKGFERRAKKAVDYDAQEPGATREWHLFMRTEDPAGFTVRHLNEGAR